MALAYAFGCPAAYGINNVRWAFNSLAADSPVTPLIALVHLMMSHHLPAHCLIPSHPVADAAISHLIADRRPENILRLLRDF